MEPVTSDGGAGVILKPGQNIRPVMTLATAKHLVKKLYGYDVTYIKELNSYDDKNYFIKVSSDHSNPHERAVRPDGYVLKILNSLDSPKQHVAAEHEMQTILRNKGVLCQRPSLTLDGNETTREFIYYSNGIGGNDQSCASSGTHLVRLMTYIPGKMIVDVLYKPDLLYGMGKYVGAITKYLEGFHNKHLENHKTIWSLASIPQLTEFTFAVMNDDDKLVVNQVIKAFEQEVIPLYSFFKTGIIHGDVNEQNVLVRPMSNQENVNEAELDYEIHGLLDFGDAHGSYCIFEIALNIMYMMLDCTVVDVMEVGGHVLAGYLTEVSLCEQEFDALKVCIAGRYCQSLVMSAYTSHQDPGNDYVLTTARRGWPQLHRLWNFPKEDLYKCWKLIIASYN